MKSYRSKCKSLLVVLATFGLVFGLSACATDRQAESPKSTLPEVTLGMTYIPNIQFSPFYVAKEKGYFSTPSTVMFDRYPGKPLGVSPIFRHHGADEGLFSALVSGKEDVVVAFGDEAMQAASQGMELTIIGVLYKHYPSVVITKTDSGIHSWQDLRGKKVGIPGRFGSNWFALQAGLRSSGMSLSDINIQEIGYQLQPYLETNKVDAVVGFINNDVTRLKGSGTDVNVIRLPKDVSLVSAVLVARRDWVNKYPERVDTLVSAMARGIDDVTQHPDEAVKITKNYDKSLTTPLAEKTARDVLTATIDLMDIPSMKQGDPGALCAPQIDDFVQMASLLRSLPGVMGNKLKDSDYQVPGIHNMVRPWPETDKYSESQ